MGNQLGSVLNESDPVKLVKLVASPETDETERERMVSLLLTVGNSGIAWLVLLRAYNYLSPDNRTELCRMVARAGVAETMVWVLMDNPNLPRRDRNLLREAIVRADNSYIAQVALGRVSDLTPKQRHQLTRIAAGMKADD